MSNLLKQYKKALNSNKNKITVGNLDSLVKNTYKHSNSTSMQSEFSHTVASQEPFLGTREQALKGLQNSFRNLRNLVIKYQEKKAGQSANNSEDRDE